MKPDGGIVRTRRRVANWLVLLARRIDPENEAAMQFWSDRMMDFILTGQSSIKVTAEPIVDMLAEQRKE